MLIDAAMTIPELKNSIDGDSRARAGECSVYAEDADVVNGIFTFSAQSSNSLNSYIERVQFMNWQTIVPPDIDPETTLIDVLSEFPQVMELEVRVDCNCPAFSYWGHQWNLTQLDTALEQAIPPTKNPTETKSGQGRYSCKHLAAVYNTFFY